MSDCLSAEMRDALPDLIHGSLDPTKLAEVEAHVASCDQCAAELELLRAVVASSPAAPPMDVRRIVAALPVAAKRGFLLHRGNGEPASAAPSPVTRSQSVWSRPALRIAAAVAVVAAGGLSLLVGREVLNPQVQVGRNTPRAAETSAPVTAPISAAPVAASVAQAPQASQGESAAGVGSGLLISEVRQLSDEHLVALLSEMDNMDAVPALEPETIEPALAESDTIGASE
jgi:anti-sigma factor RsiW